MDKEDEKSQLTGKNITSLQKKSKITKFQRSNSSNLELSKESSSKMKYELKESFKIELIKANSKSKEDEYVTPPRTRRPSSHEVIDDPYFYL